MAGTAGVGRARPMIGSDTEPAQGVARSTEESLRGGQWRGAVDDRRPASGLVADVSARASAPWGPVLRSRRAWLERPGLTAEAEELEELVVIRAQYR